MIFICCRHFYLPKLQSKFSEATVNLSFGNELATLIIKGSPADAADIEEAAKEFKSKLISRVMTIGSAQWEFLNNRKSHAFGYVWLSNSDICTWLVNLC